MLEYNGFIMSLSIDTVEKFWAYSELEIALEAADSESVRNFKAEFKDFLGTPESSMELFPSGRQALEWLLTSLNDRGGEVLAPAFNCAVVGSAVRSAGFALKTYDFSPQVGVFDWDSIIEKINPETRAVIVTHYFGVPVDFRRLLEACNLLGIPIIEDCAHCVGAKIDDKNAGTLGHAAVFSFNDDKPIALGWGGAAIISSDFVRKISIESKIITPDFTYEKNRIRTFLRKSNLKRKLIPYLKSPLVKVAREALNAFKRGGAMSECSQIGMGAIQAELGRLCLQQYRLVMEMRNQNARTFEQASMNPTWPVSSAVDPAWLRQKVFLGRSKSVENLIRSMHERGIRVDNLNWPELLIADGKNCEISSEAANFWVDVPIHQNLTKEMVESIACALNGIKRT